MGKWVVTLFCFFCASSTALGQNTLSRQCYNIPTNETDTPVLYVNERGQVNCINYGGRKIVEYIYNDAADEIELGGSKRVPGALVAKRFYNFETNPTKTYNVKGLPRRLQPTLDTWDLVTPTNEYFSLALVLEELLKFSKIKKLPDVITEYFQDDKKATQFLDTFTKEYIKLSGCKPAKKNQKHTCEQKLRALQNATDENTEHLTPPLQTVNQKQVGQPGFLNAELKSDILEHIYQKTTRGMSLAQCNPDISSGIEQILKLDRYYQAPNDMELINFAHTRILDGKMRFFLSPQLFMDLSNLTLSEAREQIDAYNPESIKKFLKYESPLNLKNKSNQYKDLPLLSWVLVRELGHSLMLNMMVDRKNEFDDMMFEMAAYMAAPDFFKNVPEGLKIKIKNETINPFTQMAETAAENFMIDAIPCIL